MEIPIALTIAGSDSSAGAGVQADLKTFNALSVYGLSAVTCVVAEIPGKVSRIESVGTDMVREQIVLLAKNFAIGAIKTGLLYSSEIISAVAKSIFEIGPRIPLVVDPVITATGGDPLLKPDAIHAYENDLFPLASLITPNLDEAKQLLGDEIKNRKAMERAGLELAQRFRTAILLKGGHLPGKDALDLLFEGQKITPYSAAFVREVATHGTGCTYSAAIAAGLASRMALEDAVSRAKKFVTACIVNHFRWRSRSGGQIDALKHSDEET